ncbi:GDSL-type esterase/lipase family protein [Streptomyces sp. bgisy100]|uniref:GDSL-type esterase/lipase family protein n=1 Tax=Streptomyces sp. bgisy100 TaxID=3413783 RepID=UPI003D74C822
MPEQPLPAANEENGSADSAEHAGTTAGTGNAGRARSAGPAGAGNADGGRDAGTARAGDTGRARDARTARAGTANGARDARTTGAGTANGARDARTTGAGTANGARDARTARAGNAAGTGDSEHAEHLETGIAADAETDPHSLSDGEAARLLAGARWRRVVVLGDGGRERRRARAADGHEDAPWYDRVTDALRGVEPGLACLNLLGGRGRRATHVRSRQLPEALAFGGDLAVLQVAGHDLLHPAFDADAFRTELVRIIAPLRERGYDVLVVEPFDLTRSPGGREVDAEVLRARQRAQTERSRTLTQRHGALHVDLSAGRSSAGAGVWGATGLVPNSRGHAVMAAAVVRALGARLRPAAGSGPPSAGRVVGGRAGRPGGGPAGGITGRPCGAPRRRGHTAPR